jgi:glycosyltransferase involved in cell wall biosynthesis
MDSNKLVSVVIPCYNNGQYLNETIQSVLNQTYHEFEIIIIDDGSTDASTKQFLSQLNHSKIHVFFKENEGVSIARNFGISHSKGEYILPLDADDLIANDYLKNGIKVFDQDPLVKLVSCNVEFFGYRKGKMIFPNYSFERLLARNLFVVASMFRRKDFNETAGFNPNMREGFEDWDFWISLLKTGGSVYRLEKSCFFYRINKKSRNNLLKEKNFSRLKRQIYENHKDLYQQYYIDPTQSFEYDLIKDSMEYKVGSFLLKPFRFWQRFRHG